MKNKIIKKIIIIISCLLIFLVGLLIILKISNKSDITKTFGTKSYQILESKPQLTYTEENLKPIAKIYVSKFGVLEFELNPQETPDTVENFIALSNLGFYNGLKINKKSNDFIQLGAIDYPEIKEYAQYKDLITAGSMDYYALKNEEKSSISHETGTISMVNDGKSNTTSFQFFITTKDAQQYDNKYTSFGRLIKGYDVLEKINDYLENNCDSISNQYDFEEGKYVIISKIEINTFEEYYDTPEITQANIFLDKN